MKGKLYTVIGIFILFVILISIFSININNKLLNNFSDKKDNFDIPLNKKINENIKIDDVYNSKEYGDIHYSVYVPEDLDPSKSHPLYITVPGHEGMYFQGAGKNLEYEYFVEAGIKINKDMIILAPQLEDWGDNSANKVIALIDYYKELYNISEILASGYSEGGKTISLVIDKRPDLIKRYLHIASQWDGNYDNVVNNQIPVYLFVGKDDEYYGSETVINTYNELHSLYTTKGLSNDMINKLLILDVRDKDYFIKHDFTNIHAGATWVAHDDDIMNWLLKK